jgi:hypothetical protein
LKFLPQLTGSFDMRIISAIFQGKVITAGFGKLLAIFMQQKKQGQGRPCLNGALTESVG